MMGHPHLRPGGAVSARTTAQERYPLRHIAILDVDPAAKDRSPRTPEGETLVGRDRNQLIYPLAEGRVISDEQKQQAAPSQTHSQRRRMSQPPSLRDRCVAPCQCPIGKAETEKHDPQEPR